LLSPLSTIEQIPLKTLKLPEMALANHGITTFGGAVRTAHHLLQSSINGDEVALNGYRVWSGKSAEDPRSEISHSVQFGSSGFAFTRVI
jgi:hypothetical protein